MNSPKKYEQAEEESLMLNESLGLETATSTLRMNQFGESVMGGDADDMDVPSLQYSLEELNDRISAGIEQYQRGVFYSQEDAHTLFDQWKKRA